MSGSKSSLPLPVMDGNAVFGNESSVPLPTGVMSPMTDLAVNLGSLSTRSDVELRALPSHHESLGSTPKCKLSLSLSDTPTLKPWMQPFNCGFIDSPTPIDSPSLEFRSFQFPENNRSIRGGQRCARAPLRRLNSLPLESARNLTLRPGKENSTTTNPRPQCAAGVKGQPLRSPKRQLDLTMATTPAVSAEHMDTDSQDSGLGTELKENESAVALHRHAPGHSVLFHPDDANMSAPSPERKERAISAPSVMFQVGSGALDDQPLGNCSLTSCEQDTVDDGFLDCLSCGTDVEESSAEAPVHLLSLITGPVTSLQSTFNLSTIIDSSPESTKKESDTPKGAGSKMRSCRPLFARSPSAPEPNNRLARASSFKRPEPPRECRSPVSNKRRRSINMDCPAGSALVVEEPRLHRSHSVVHGFHANMQPPPPSTTAMRKPTLQRCHSETEATIMRALQRCTEEPNLIGDFSKPFALPLCKGKHNDLKCITPETVCRLINNEFEDSIHSYTIIDARFPYEFEGGHIQGAKNIYTKDHLLTEFMDAKVINALNLSKRTILVFHCEFSSERGPGLSRFLRNMDRDANKEAYPQLCYPEVYLLEGGYKAFYHHCKELCEPRSYLPMNIKGKEDELRLFKARSKSWNGEKAGRPAARPGLCSGRP
ncbi:PREDICTED: M-phase inducer phosphatase-like [Priapulus caudatus]|uniref:M-phase inducer phosphatase n=1 Tax=Priapulus caudatus TaxID=37621 RepID=A0ABM1E7U4_PRICU|nr:PREDICTED: M-phase inducer phosphatase-like [Priapulus caudatus]